MQTHQTASKFAVYGCLVVVFGDFNVHVDQPDDIYAGLLQSFVDIQHVAEPTHSAIHLDITTSATSISDLRVCVMVSDQALIRFTLHVNRPALVTQKVALLCSTFTIILLML